MLGCRPPAWPADVRPRPLVKPQHAQQPCVIPRAAFYGAPFSKACSDVVRHWRGSQVVVMCACAVRRWVRTGWSKKILRFCGATADEVRCGLFVVPPRWNQRSCRWSGPARCASRCHPASVSLTETASGLPGAALPRGSRWRGSLIQRLHYCPWVVWFVAHSSMNVAAAGSGSW